MESTENRGHSASLSRPWAPFVSGWRNRRLIVRLTRRDIEARYRGSLLGLLWSVLVPIIMLLVYTFVFTVVFKSKWDIPAGGKGHFVLLLFCGLILFNFFAECLNRAPLILLAHTSYIKKVVFPLEILPWVVVMVALFNAAISYSILVVTYLILLGMPPITVVFFPIIILPIILFSLGLTLIFSSIGVFVRDLQQLMGLITMVVMFTSPLFYPLSSLPEKFRSIVQLSPIAIAIEESRKVLFFNQIPNFYSLSICLITAALTTWLGFVWFMKTKKGFADVI